MSSAYSVSVDWGEYDEKWEQTGQNVMRSFYEENPKEAEKDGHELDEDGQVKYLDEVIDEWYPMMNYAYPLETSPSENKIIQVCRETCLTVVYNNEDETYYLALCGGGMDLSQSIAYAYQIIENWIPMDMVMEICKQPELSVHGKRWLGLAKQIRKQLKMDIGHLRRTDKEWQESVRQYKLSRKKGVNENIRK